MFSTKSMDYISKLTCVVNEYNEQAEQLGKDFKEIENNLLDTYHYIEMNDLDVFRGFNAYKKLQNELRCRREIKDAKRILDNIRTPMNEIRNIIHHVEEYVNNRDYEERSSRDIFCTKQTELERFLNTHPELVEFDTVEETISFIRGLVGNSTAKEKSIRNNLENSINTGAPHYNYFWSMTPEGKLRGLRNTK